MIDESSIIRNQSGEYSITICFENSAKFLFLYAKEIEGANEIFDYTYHTGRNCEFCQHNFIYSPVKAASILEALKKRKLYGIIDSMACGKGHSITLLSRCNQDCIEISYPVLLCKFCSSETCVNDTSLKEFQRTAVTFFPESKMTPVAIIKKTSCKPFILNEHSE